MRTASLPLLAGLALATATATGCLATPEVDDPTGWVVRTYEREFLGEPVRLTVWAKEIEVAEADAAAIEAFRAVARVDQAAGDRGSIAEVRALVGGGPWVAVSGELYRMIAGAVDVAEATNGAYDPTIGPLEIVWRQARKRGRLPGDQDLYSARSRTGWKQVEVAPRASRVRLSAANMLLDLSLVLHGAACDEALARLARSGFSRARVDFGSALAVGDAPPGTKSWKVELPQHAGTQAIELVNSGVASCGDREEWFELEGRRWSADVDPLTGLGFTRARLATVAAGSGLEAEALARALRATGDDERRRGLVVALGVQAWVTEP